MTKCNFLLKVKPTVFNHVSLHELIKNVKCTSVCCLHLVLEKTEVFGHNATQADKKQVEHLVSAKEIKQNICQDHSDSSNDEDETSEECYDLKEVSNVGTAQDK